MSTRSARIYRCLLISPSDVADARAAVTRAVAQWNAHLGPALHCRIEQVYWQVAARPELGESVQDVLNDAIVDDADFAIALFWTRVGTPTREHVSGSAEEIERLRSSGRRVMVYFCSAPPPADGRAEQQPEQLAQLRAHYATLGPVASFESIDALERLVHAHLTSLVTELLQHEPDGLDGATPSANAELRRLLAKLSSQIAAYILAGRNLKLVFDLSGEAALDEDQSADALLTNALVAYNQIYDTLRIEREVSIQQIAACAPDARAEEHVRDLLSAVEDAHRRGPFLFNKTFRSSVVLRGLRRKIRESTEDRALLEAELKVSRSSAIETMRECVSDTDNALRALESKMQDFAQKVRPR